MTTQSWNGIPLIKPVINFYQRMRFITEIIEDQNIVIEYENVWYTLSNNGGEINIHKVNDSAYYREFPTVYFGNPLNSETLMYRLCATLDGREIDYQFVETSFHHTLLEAA